MKKIGPNRLASTLKGISELAGQDYADLLQELTGYGFEVAVYNTAVRTGFLRSQWRVVEGVAPNRPISHPDAAIYHTITSVKYSLPSKPNMDFSGDVKVTIFNNTEYAGYLDDGTAKMRAQPMIQPTYMALLDRAKRLSKQLTKKVYNV